MNPDELIVGEFYALKVAAGADCVRVRAVPGTAKRRGRVLVVPEHGEDRGDALEVPRRRIVGSWDEYAADGIVLKATSAFAAVAWMPKVGEMVEVKGMGAVRWSVVDAKPGELRATVKTTLFGRPHKRTVDFAAIRPARPQPAIPHPRKPVVRQSMPPSVAPESGEKHAPDEDVLELTSEEGIAPAVIADRLIFSREACDQYRRLEPRCRRGSEGNRMRSRIRRQGKLVRCGRPNEYVAVRVPRWFDVVLEKSPSRVDGDIFVNELKVAPWRAKRGRKTQRRAA